MTQQTTRVTWRRRNVAYLVFCIHTSGNVSNFWNLYPRILKMVGHLVPRIPLYPLQLLHSSHLSRHYCLKRLAWQRLCGFTSFSSRLIAFSSFFASLFQLDIFGGAVFKMIYVISLSKCFLELFLHSLPCPCLLCKLQLVVLSTQFEELPHCRHVLCVFVAPFVCAWTCTSVWTMCVKSGRTDSAWPVTGLVEQAENLPVPVMGWSIGEPLPFSLLLTPFISCSKFLLFDITIQSNCLLFSQLFKPQSPSNSLAKATLCMAGKGKTIAMLVFSDPAFLFLNKTLKYNMFLR